MKISRVVIIIIVLVLLVLGSGFYLLAQSIQGTNIISCDNPLGGHKILRTNLSIPTPFGGVTKFLLPAPLRNPNAVYVAPDNSVWFGEQTIPGVGHLFQNGTLVEYGWPFSYPVARNSSSGVCIPKTETWGITFWNGRIWATDSSGNQLVGLDPASGEVHTVKVSGNISFPYTLTVSPTGSLWFTELYNGKIGSLDQNGHMQEYNLPGGSNAVPSEITFANSTVAYYVDVGEAGVGNGGIYTFNPQNANPQNLTVHKVGIGKKLNTPTSIALAAGGIWLAIHGASNLVFYNQTGGNWSDYPTSTISYASTTLPYFVRTNGSLVWFNEHYADKLARIDLADGSLTEFSLSHPPVSNGTQIGNALTFGLGRGSVWFAQWTANYVGFLNATYRPPFSASVLGSKTVDIPAGSSGTIDVLVHGQSRDPLVLSFSDSEATSAQPDLIHFTANATKIQSLQGSSVLQVTLTAEHNLSPGVYTALVTVSAGIESSSVYVRVHASQPKQ